MITEKLKPKRQHNFIVMNKKCFHYDYLLSLETRPKLKKPHIHKGMCFRKQCMKIWVFLTPDTLPKYCYHIYEKPFWLL